MPPGNGPGGINPDFQDLNPPDATSNPDRYLVFHFHTDHIDASDNLPGVYAVVAFHGQRYLDGRIDGWKDDPRHRRARVLLCRRTRQRRYWYPGYTYGDVSSFPQWGQIMVEFGEYLAAEGILTAATFLGPTQGQLELLVLDPNDADNCHGFDWNGYTQSRQFGPNGSPPRNQLVW